MSKTAFNCCRYCTDRTIGCHGICKEYIEASQKYNEEKKKIRYEKSKSKNYIDMKVKNVNKTLRRKAKEY